MPIVTPFKSAQAVPYLQSVKSKKPLIHCITNDVVQNFTANTLLAIGAIPAMVIAREEVEHFTSIADSLLINLGTVTSFTAPSMLLAAETAFKSKKPWVLDPVAVGPALAYRYDLAQQLLAFKPTVIRGNASEILALDGKPSLSKGPDSKDSTYTALKAAQALAREHQTVIAMTGEVDYITNGDSSFAIMGGDIALTRVTGTGCALSAMVAAFICGSDSRLDNSSEHHLQATAAACLMMKSAGELANNDLGLGTFSVSLIDQLSLIKTF